MESIVANSTSIVSMSRSTSGMPSSSSASPWDSTFHLTVACLLVFVLSPVIICSNGLLIACLFRYKKLRNASNDFLLCLCVVDLSIGVLLPFSLYFEITRSQIDCIILCLIPMCVLLMLCGVSMLNMCAIALDRYISLAFPLQYTNIITHRSVAKYVASFWIYSLVVSSSPLVFWFASGHSDTTISECSFQATILPSAWYFIVFTLYIPCACTMLCCYSYVYMVARGHARAIFSVEVSLRRRKQQNSSSTSTSGDATNRYGRTLAVTVGCFLLCWLPFLVGMTIAMVNRDSSVLAKTASFYFALLVLANSAANPWIYGYRNTEIRRALLKILTDVLPKLAHTLQTHQTRQGINRQPGFYPSCASQVGLITTHYGDNGVVTEVHALSTTNYLHVPYDPNTCSSSQVFNLSSPGYAYGDDL